jgi:predicted DsbA family dithiol-disulfide isomerase
VRLAKIENEFGAAVSVTWKSFLLRPSPRERSLERFRAYTESWQVPASQSDGGRFRVWSTDEAPPSHSIPPNVAVKAAAYVGGREAFDRYHLALMDAYFYENRNVTDRATLVRVAEGCDMDSQAFAAALDEPALLHQVLEEHEEAVAAGISGVPTVVLDEQFAIPGAQDMNFYRRLVEKRLERGGAS